MSNKMWGKIKEQLKASHGREFERNVLPYLRVKWPQLALPESLGVLDARGIDMVVVGKSERLELVVQCKGFEVQEPLGDSQLAQIQKSIASFNRSRHRCETYVLVYNRHGVDRDFAEQVNSRLDALKTSGKALDVALWDLDALAKQLDRELAMRLLNEIQRLGEEAGQQARSHFLFGDVVLTDVPHEVGSMKLRHHALPEVQMSGNVVDGDPLSIVNQAQALGAGPWSSGSSAQASRRFLGGCPNSQTGSCSIPASALTHAEAGAGSENSLARAIVEYLGVFDEASEFGDEERRVINWLAGPLLAARLRDQKTKFTLLIDGLDENRF